MDEIPSTPPLPTEFTSMVNVWEYCEQRWRVTRTVSLPVEHAAALEKFLAHPDMRPGGRGGWSLAVYVPECEDWASPNPGGHERGSAGHRQYINEGCARDMRAFFRIGFEQSTEVDNRVYLTQRRRSVRLSHHDAMAIQVPIEHHHRITGRRVAAAPIDEWRARRCDEVHVGAHAHDELRVYIDEG